MAVDRRRQTAPFFLPSHDEAAEAAVVLAGHGSGPVFLVCQGCAPGDMNPSRVLLACKQRAAAHETTA
ncbi:MAG TPA: hypothetical protein VF043_30880 [Ktedonobacteraceae bacterium]